MENNQDHPKILLYWLRQSSLVLECNSGVTYCSQAGNYSCSQRCIEGVLIPLIDWPTNQYVCPLEKLLSGLSWGPILGIDEERAYEIDEILSRWLSTKFIKVDREKMSDSEEAWIHVIVSKNDIASYKGFSQSTGVLIWSNSD